MQTDIQTYKYKDRQTDRQADTQTDRQTDRQPDRIQLHLLIALSERELN